jgi:hypothetical protein
MFMMRSSRTLILALAALVMLVLPTQVQTQGASRPGRLLDPVDVPGLDKPVRVILGRFTSDVTLTNNYYWVLRGAVFVGRGADLTIQAGTRIVGEYATLGTLIIEQGGRIFANGTAAAPIVFTSDQPIGQRGRADWGGLILNGEAPINLPGGLGVGEGDTGRYGGTFAQDNSGVLRYVRVEYAGVEFSPDNELNGIAFQGVGRGTTVDYVQVKLNKDDGVEFFGGTVDAKHLVLTGIADDSIDWTFGWTGRVQYAVIQQRGDDADNGFEADNNGNNNDLLPRSAPTIFNVTLIGDPDTNEGNESDDGMEIREGTAGTIRNFIVMGFKEHGIDISNTATIAQADNGALSFGNGIMFQNAILPGFAHFDSDARKIPSVSSNPTIVTAAPGLADPYNLTQPNFRPASPSSLAMTHPAAVPPNDGFFEIANFIGALSWEPAKDWTLGWTDYAQK